MISKIILLAFVFIQISAFSQNELINVYSSFSKVHGGTEDGGISGSEHYVFLTKKKVVLDNITFENKAITLTKKDSLVFTIKTYVPYHTNHVVVLDSATISLMVSSIAVDIKIFTKVSKKGNTYFVTDPFWNGTISYTYKGNTCTATKKEKFDTGYEGYAP